ncbi:MAG: AAA family ATPase [Bacillota bacterium]
MRPKLLKISGLNSFVEEQEIDFSTLTEKGLFGIFGPTGSGKSTILDAVTIALYGRISRDTKEFINKETEELYVYFEFALGVTGNYTVERKMKISETGGYKTTLARLVVEEEGREEIFDQVTEIDDQLEEIIGLNHEDFMRTVVLPQGKFSRFLKLTGRDRRDMLERILGLEEFGAELLARLKKERNKRQDKKNELQAVLNKYQDISEASLEKEKERLEQLHTDHKQVSGRLKEKTAQYEKYKNIRKLQSELENYQKQQTELEKKEDAITRKKERLNKTKKVVQIKSDLTRYLESIEEKKKTVKKISELQKELQELSSQKELLVREQEKLVRKKEEKLPELAEKKVKIEAALEKKEENENLQQEINTQKEKVASRAKKKKKLAAELEKIKKDIAEYRNKLECREKEQDELQVSSEYRKMVSRGREQEKSYRLLKKELTVLKEEKQKLATSLKKREQKLADLVKKLTKIEKQIWQSQKKKITAKEEEKQNLTEKLSELEKEIGPKEEKLNRLKKEIKQIERQNMAGILARELEDEVPCPVCGSREHPAVAKETDVDLSHREQRIKEVTEQLSELQEEKNQTAADLKIVRQEIKQSRAQKQKLLSSLQTSQRELVVPEDDSEEGKELPEESRDRLQKEWEDLRARISELKGGLDRDQQDLDSSREKLAEKKKEVEKQKKKYQQMLAEIKEDSFEKVVENINQGDEKLEKLRGKIKGIKSKLAQKEAKRDKLQVRLEKKKDQFLQFENELNNLQKDYEKNKNQIEQKVGDKNPREYLQEVEKEKRELQKKAKAKKEKLATVRSKLNDKQSRESTLKDRKQRLEKVTGELKKQLEEKIEKFGFSDFAEAKKYLKWETEISDWETEINDYEKQKTDLENNINRLQDELDGASLSGEEWEQVKEQKSVLEKKQGQLQQNIGACRTKIASLKEDLADKKETKKEKEEIEHESALIKEINDLVRGKSFVEFVAIRRLRYIAREASQKLMEITNHRYRLELNDRGEFVICDLHNGGVKRGCNTLSGGETFLTSLSLALALSSQVQLKGTSSMEFFFLDEGFGTLDTNLLDVVMNSLEKLQDENLAVGIISHVEELKNRVPVKLMVQQAQPGIRGTRVNIEYS